MYINKKQWETLCKIEHLLFVKSDELFGENKDRCIRFDDELINYNDISDYWNIVEKIAVARDKHLIIDKIELLEILGA